MLERGVKHGENQIVVRGLRGDLGEWPKMDLIINHSGDVIITLMTKEGVATSIEFVTGQGGGRSPILTAKMRDTIHFIADKIESGEIYHPK